MSLKRFSDFNKVKESHTLTNPVIKEPVVKEPIVKEPEIKEPIIKRNDNINVSGNTKNDNKEKMSETFQNVEFFNKIAIFKNVVKSHDALIFLENAKIDKNKLWYFLMDRNESTFQIVKYNLNEGFHLNDFVTELIRHYKNNIVINKHLTENLKISGGKEFVVISNINPIFKNILKTDLIKLLSK